MKTTYEDIRGSRRKLQKNTLCVIDEKDKRYRVYEMSANGFSFLCPNTLCTFQKWQKLNHVAILNGEGVEIVRAMGNVVHVTEYNDRLKQIGVFYTQKSLDRTITGRIRTPRKYPRIRLNAELRCLLEEKIHVVSGHVLDYTAATARIGIDEACRPDPAVSRCDDWHVVIRAGEKVLLDCEALLIRKKSDGTEVVLNFTDKLLDVNFAEAIYSTEENKKSLQIILNQMAAYDPVDVHYKAALNDFRMYLKKTKDTLDQLDTQRIYDAPWEKELFVREVEGEFIDVFNRYLGRFNTFADGLREEEKPPYKSYFRENINYYVHVSPIGASMIDKEKGYSGDFETIKQFFEDPYAGETLYAKLMSRYICSTGAVRAHQERIAFLYDELVKCFHEADSAFSFMSIGSGPAEEVLRLIGNHSFDKAVTATLVDMDAFALADFSDRLQYLTKRNFMVDLVNLNIIKLLRKSAESPIRKDYHMAYCAGLFDYISDKICRRIIKFMIECTRPGGVVVVTNVHTKNFHRHIMDFGFEWEIIHRDEEEMAALVPANYPVELLTDETHTNIFLKIAVPAQGHGCN